MNQNKAIATAERLDFAPNIIPVDKYINEGNCADILSFCIEEPVMVVAAVDNAATRHILLNALEELFEEYIWICPSNGYEDVQTSLYIKGDGFNMTHPFDRYSNLRDPKDWVPGNCYQETPSSPQLITANMMAAQFTMILVNKILSSQREELQNIPTELLADINQIKVKFNV